MSVKKAAWGVEFPADALTQGKCVPRNGLRYLNICGRKIIHYDIKPSNVFYHAGQASVVGFILLALRLQGSKSLRLAVNFHGLPSQMVDDPVNGVHKNVPN